MLNDYFQWWSYVHGADWRHPTGPDSNIQGRDLYPVVQIAYEDAAPHAQRAIIEGVEIIYADLPTLIASKETYRDQDRVDVARLRELLRRNLGE